MRLIQIPFSHNCIKVRRALELKRLAFETFDISPMDRDPVAAASGQRLVPVLEDGDVTVSESSAILRHLEERYPEPSLLPDDPADHAACWLLEDWADLAFMALSRRIAYWRILAAPGALPALFFPQARGLRRALLTRGAKRVVARRFRLSESRNREDEREVPRLARIAVERLAGRPHLFARTTVADVALAANSAPLAIAAPAVRNDERVAALLAWGETILGSDVSAQYRRLDEISPR